MKWNKSYYKKSALFFVLLRLLVPCLLFIFLMMNSGCTLWSDGWHKRMEEYSQRNTRANEKNEKHNKARNEKELNKEEKAKWKADVDTVPKQKEVPEEKDPFGTGGNFLSILISIAVAVLGGGYGLHRVGKTLLDTPSKEQHGVLADILKAIHEKDKNA